MRDLPFPPASVTSRIVDSLLAKPVTGADLDRAALHVLDWAGVAMAALDQPVAAALAKLVDRPFAGPAATRIDGRKAGLEQAILFNGALGNVLEMDDVHREAVLHAGDVVIPAALAVAEARDADGATCLAAILGGYELAILLAKLTGPAHYRTFYPTATAGIFGATFAVARLMGLGADDITSALGHAGMMAAGLWQCRLEACDAKQTIAAHAALSALRAAEMAEAGLKGPRHILEGDLGFLAALAPAADAGKIALGPTWLLHEVSFKPWPACRHVHPVIEAAITLRGQGVLAADVVHLDIATYETALTFADAPRPASPHAARFSLQHGVAVALLKGYFGLTDSAPEAIDTPSVAALRAKVRVAPDAELSAIYPRRFPARLQATLRDGSVKTVMVASAKGDPENPMTTAEIHDKARGWFATRMTPAAADALVAAATALPSTPIRQFTAALAAPATA